MDEDPPPIRGICETVLYTDDIAASRSFYAGVLRLRLAMESAAILTFEVGTSQLLLVFLRSESAKDHEIYGGVIPGHRADGPAHIAFHVSIRDFDSWRAHFERNAVPINGEITFPAGGRSLYFNDPSGNVLELATPGHWSNF